MKYTVIGTITRDGKTLKVGKDADFDDDEAAKLLRDGYIEPSKQPEPKKDAGK